MRTTEPVVREKLKRHTESRHSLTIVEYRTFHSISCWILFLGFRITKSDLEYCSIDGMSITHAKITPARHLNLLRDQPNTL